MLKDLGWHRRTWVGEVFCRANGKSQLPPKTTAIGGGVSLAGVITEITSR